MAKKAFVPFEIKMTRDEIIDGLRSQYGSESVSYTHLTLPTNREV